MDEKILLRTHRPAHQSKRLALSFSIHFSFFSAELFQDFYRQNVGRRTVVPAGVSGPEFQLEIAAQSSSRIFVELD
eukprot:COSAG02_NODE_106_length_36326_cov_13.777266_38_plen_75_part_01